MKKSDYVAKLYILVKHTTIRPLNNMFNYKACNPCKNIITRLISWKMCWIIKFSIIDPKNRFVTETTVVQMTAIGRKQQLKNKKN